MIPLLLFAFQVCWTPPTENVDGTPIDGLQRFSIFYGVEANNYTHTVWVSENATCANVRAAEGAYFVAMTATDLEGDESGYSNVVQKTETRLGGPSGGRLLGPSGGRVITEE